jgi:hypothetical protein
MTDNEIEKLIHANQRLNLVLGYAMAFIFEYSKNLPESEQEKYDWLCNAIENIVYLDKPLTRMP